MKFLQKFKDRRFWLPILSALVTLGAFPPFNLIPLLFVGLVPLLYVLQTAESPKEAFKAGNRFGLIYMLGQLFFIFILANRWTGNIPLALIPWLACGAVGQLYFGLAGLAIHRAFKLKTPWSLLIPLAWAGIEVFRSQINFIGFPWGLLATPLWRYPALLGAARYLTVFGLSAWIVAVNLAFLASFTQDFKAVRRFAFVSLVVIAISLLQNHSADPPSQTLRVFCIQPGVDQAFGDAKIQEDKQAVNIDILMQEAEARDPDLIVLPEGVDRLRDEPIPHPAFGVPPGIPIIFGAQRGTGPIFQSVFSFDGQTWTHADKTRLVIFGEYVPGRKLFGFLDNFHLAADDLEPGKRVDPLTINFPSTHNKMGGKTTIGPLICYEGLFYDCAQAQAANGARLLAVVSIDDWFMESPAPEQLEAAAVFRSVETNLPTVRAASTGHTMACDNKGNILAEIPIQTRSGMPVKVDIPDYPQPSWWLGFFPFICFAVTVTLLCLGIRLKRPTLPSNRSTNQRDS